MNTSLPLKVLALTVLGLTSAQARADGGNHGQSKHGSAFDAGLRSKPWLMKGIGNETGGRGVRGDDLGATASGASFGSRKSPDSHSPDDRASCTH